MCSLKATAPQEVSGGNRGRISLSCPKVQGLRDSFSIPLIGEEGVGSNSALTSGASLFLHNGNFSVLRTLELKIAR